MSLANTYEEKRNFIRMKLHSPVTIKQGDKTLDAVCVDLSGTGMCIELEDQLPLGQALEAYIPSYQNQFAPLNASIRINRCMEESGKFLYGAEIVELLG